MSKGCLSLALVLGFIAYAQADDGWWSEAGGIGCFGKGHPSIRMVSEDLKLKVLDDGFVSVDVLFTFHNDGLLANVTMAFPESYEMRTGGSLKDFRTWVDGNRVSVKRRVITEGDPKAADPQDEMGKAVWLKKVRFAANQTHAVRVTYLGLISGDTSGNRTFTYTLTSGASWKGTIETCKIAVTWPPELSLTSPIETNLSAPILGLRPAKWQYIPGRTAVATLTRWKPKDDLTLSMYPGFGNFWINGKQIDPAELRKDFEFYSPPTIGTTRDPMIRVSMIDGFLGQMALNHSVKSGLASYSHGAVTLAGGKRVKLARPSKTKSLNDSDQEEFVFVKDLVEAAGGKFHYNVDFSRVELTL